MTIKKYFKTKIKKPIFVIDDNFFLYIQHKNYGTHSADNHFFNTKYHVYRLLQIVTDYRIFFHVKYYSTYAMIIIQKLRK